MKNRRQLHALRSLSRVPPSLSEAEDLHSFHLKYGRETPDDGTERVWMGDTTSEKTMLMFPQERKYVPPLLDKHPSPFSYLLAPSVHQKVFGGYLMRLAYEVRSLHSITFLILIMTCPIARICKFFYFYSWHCSIFGS